MGVRRGDLISVDDLWDKVFDAARDKAWLAVDRSDKAAYDIACGKINIINWMCNAARHLQPVTRQVPNDEPKEPVLVERIGAYIQCGVDGTA